MKTAIVTIYNPKDEVFDNINTIAAQVDRVILCDNSSYPSKFPKFYRDNILYTYNDGENLGLSGAYNKVLTNRKYNWQYDDYIIFFDQDSKIPQNHIEKLIQDYERLESNGYRVGCLGPIYFEKNSNKLKIQKQKKELLTSVYSVKSIITSSMLCQFRRISEIGFWNESVFLDMADWDLCWRFIESGYLCCVTKNTILSHVLGSYTKKLCFVRLKVDKPFRNYYQVRESLYLFRKKYVPVKFKIRILMMLFIRNPLRLLLLDQKKEQLFYMKNGYADWKAHKKGSIPIYYENR